MNIKQTGKNDWQECPTGTLSHYAKNVRIHRTQTRIIRVGSAALLVGALCIGGSYWLTGSNSPHPRSANANGEPNYGGIVCSQVKLNARSFAKNELDKEIADKIQEHIKMCPICSEHISKVQNGLAVNRRLVEHLVVRMNTSHSDRW